MADERHEAEGGQPGEGKPATRRGFATRAIHTARYRGKGAGQPVAFPIFQTAGFAFDSAEEQEAVNAGKLAGYAYTRTTNPTFDALHQTMAALEGAQAAMSFASGVGAIHAALATFAGAGDHVVCTNHVYGGTHNLLTRTLPRFGVEHTFVDATDPEAVRRALRPNTRVLWAEVISNPLTTVLDLRALAAIAHEADAALVVDATLASPYLARPLEDGADLVVHSATKYIGGHGDLVAGIVCGRTDLVRRARYICLDVGGIAAPLEAWLMLRGLKTLGLRMERHSANALAVARFLDEHPRVERVNYPGLPSHPQHVLASERMPRGHGGLLSFEVPGGKAGAFRVLNALRLALRAASLGDADTLASHPATVSHSAIAPEVRRAAGVPDGLIRLAVGLEDPDDILADLDQALAAL